MRGDNLDAYATTFKHLAKVAGYDLANLGMVHLFTMGLKAGLRNAILHRDNQSTMFNEWVTTAQNEMQKFARRQAFERKDYTKYQWTTPRPTSTRQNGCHPNDIPTPMDVDPPVFSRVRRAYTEDDKDRYKKEGRCFNCDQRGHMAHECPKKKQQIGQSSQSGSYKPQNDQLRTKPKTTFKKKPFGSKPIGQAFRKKNQFSYKPQI